VHNVDVDATFIHATQRRWEGGTTRSKN